MDYLKNIPRTWEKEPSLITGEFFGLACVVYRHPELKHSCGYVRIPKKHPYYGYAMADERLGDIKVHGSITWADEKIPVAHLKENKKNHWWFGFDTAHLFDLVPHYVVLAEQDEQFAMIMRPIIMGSFYRDITFVRRETAKMAWQLAGNSLTDNEAAFNKAYHDAMQDSRGDGFKGVPVPV